MKDEHMALAVINHNMRVLRELAALPEQSELSLHRAQVAAKAVEEACHWLMALADARAMLARVAA